VRVLKFASLDIQVFWDWSRVVWYVVTYVSKGRFVCIISSRRAFVGCLILKNKTHGSFETWITIFRVRSFTSKKGLEPSTPLLWEPRISWKMWKTQVMRTSRRTNGWKNKKSFLLLLLPHLLSRVARLRRIKIAFIFKNQQISVEYTHYVFVIEKNSYMFRLLTKPSPGCTRLTEMCDVQQWV
jgi:hypothetical protein